MNQREQFEAWASKENLPIVKHTNDVYVHLATVYAWEGYQAAQAQQPAPCPTCVSLARTVMLDQTGHDDYYKRMFESAVSSLAKIDQLLGINDDGCGGAEETIDAVRELVNAHAMTPQEPDAVSSKREYYELYQVRRHGFDALLLGTFQTVEQGQKAADVWREEIPRDSFRLELVTREVVATWGGIAKGEK